MLLGKKENIDTLRYTRESVILGIRPVEVVADVDDDYYEYDDYDDGYVMSGRYEYGSESVVDGQLGAAIEQLHSAGYYVVGKEIRPWTVDRAFFSRLDRDKPWVGFEMEHGFASYQDAIKGLKWVYDNTDDACIDVEGYGSWPIEVTFAPSDKDDWPDTCGPIRLINAITSGEYGKVADHNSGDSIGTHFNFSTPLIRTGGPDAVDYGGLVYTASCTLSYFLEDKLDTEDCEQLFGRSYLYEYEPIFFRDNRYVECKWFNSTFNANRFRSYLPVMFWMLDLYNDAGKLDNLAAGEADLDKEFNRLVKVSREAHKLTIEQIKERSKCEI
jgi:hypothetical protein